MRAQSFAEIMCFWRAPNPKVVCAARLASICSVLTGNPGIEVKPHERLCHLVVCTIFIGPDTGRVALDRVARKCKSAIEAVDFTGCMAHERTRFSTQSYASDVVKLNVTQRAL